MLSSSVRRSRVADLPLESCRAEDLSLTFRLCLRVLLEVVCATCLRHLPQCAVVELLICRWSLAEQRI